MQISPTKSAHAVKQAVDADYTAGYTAQAVKQAVKADYTAGYTAQAVKLLGKTDQPNKQLPHKRSAAVKRIMPSWESLRRCVNVSVGEP